MSETTSYLDKAKALYAKAKALVAAHPKTASAVAGFVLGVVVRSL